MAFLPIPPFCFISFLPLFLPLFPSSFTPFLPSPFILFLVFLAVLSMFFLSFPLHLAPSPLIHSVLKTRNKYSQKWNCAVLFPIYNFIYCICERFIYSQFPTICPQTQYSKKADQSWKYINREQIHECRNSKWGRKVSFLGLFDSNFSCRAFFPVFSTCP